MLCTLFAINFELQAHTLNQEEIVDAKTIINEERVAILRQAINVPSTTPYQKLMTMRVSELTDSSGLVYLGGKVSRADLSIYLKQLNNVLGEKFSEFRANQSARDHSSFHLTLINPYEYQTIDKSKVNLGQSFKVTLLGLGSVSKETKNAYFVVAHSNDAQFFRQQFALSAKDFHVTLGFNPSDIYGVSKGVDTLLQE